MDKKSWEQLRVKFPDAANQPRSLLSEARSLNELKSTMDDDCAIGILFKDRAYLGFDLDPFLRITPDFPDWKPHNYKPLKRWLPRTE